MLFDRCHTKNRKKSLKQHTKHFNFRSKIQLDHTVQVLAIPDGTPDAAPDAATPDEVAVGTDPLIENDKTRSGPK